MLSTNVVNKHSKCKCIVVLSNSHVVHLFSFKFVPRINISLVVDDVCDSW